MSIYAPLIALSDNYLDLKVKNQKQIFEIKKCPLSTHQLGDIKIIKK